MTITPARIILLLVAVALVAVLATVATIGGFVVYVAMQPTPTTRPVVRVPAAPAYSAPQRTAPDIFGSEYQRQQDQRAKESCDRQWRDYQSRYNEYLDGKTSGGSAFSIAPREPWC